MVIFILWFYAAHVCHFVHLMSFSTHKTNCWSLSEPVFHIRLVLFIEYIYKYSFCLFATTSNVFGECFVFLSGLRRLQLLFSDALLTRAQNLHVLTARWLLVSSSWFIHPPTSPWEHAGSPTPWNAPAFRELQRASCQMQPLLLHLESGDSARNQKCKIGCMQLFTLILNCWSISREGRVWKVRLNLECKPQLVPESQFPWRKQFSWTNYRPCLSFCPPFLLSVWSNC